MCLLGWKHHQVIWLLHELLQALVRRMQPNTQRVTLGDQVLTKQHCHLSLTSDLPASIFTASGRCLFVDFSTKKATADVLYLSINAVI